MKKIQTETKCLAFVQGLRYFFAVVVLHQNLRIQPWEEESNSNLTFWGNSGGFSWHSAILICLFLIRGFVQEKDSEFKAKTA